MSSLIRFASAQKRPARRSLGDLLQELALLAPAQLAHLQGLVEWMLDQIKSPPVA